ncbi:hypothetical protein QN277_000769 [Acacia crassicarpa]|uniref:U-box domain-containing protein n=1 Tax=Acacia crassicarpa TaxID=499986 RepID=A0AAE1THJ7_9FABA|nr:hypothetical protein QN277_000769 [Acacia crassicarpa]
MFDPVVIASDHTFEHVVVQVCRDLNFSPNLEDGSRLDFSTVISNLAIRSTISSWCKNSSTKLPHAPEYSFVVSVVRESMVSQKDLPNLRVSKRELLRAVVCNPSVILSHAATELLGPRVNHFDSGSSEESEIVMPNPSTPLHLATRLAYYSSSSSSSVTVESEFQNPNGPISKEEDKLVSKMKSSEEPRLRVAYCRVDE